MNSSKINLFFKIYIITIFFLSILILYHKFLYPTDWTTSEWLINYHGGFIRRGLIGELLLSINQFLNLNPRYLVYIFEVIILAFYYYLIIKFIKLNYLPILVLIIFSPLSFIYPVAETETIARKETLLFCIYIIFLISLISNNLRLSFFVTIVLLPIMSLIWDGIFFYIPFFILTFLNQGKKIEFKKFVFFLLSFIPYLLTLYILFNTKASQEGLLLMCEAIREPCFASMNYLDESLGHNINQVHSNFKIEYLLRHLFIFIICFYAIFSLLNKVVSKNTLLLQYSLCVLPTFVLFYIAYDWGRYLNILYIFSLLTIIFFIKKKIVNTSKSNFNKFLEYLYHKRKLLFYFLFFSYLFLWKSLAIMSDDLGSLPYIRILDKVIELIVI
jgi:hypothetical protein